MKATKVATVSALLLSMVALSSAQTVNAESGFVQPEEVSPGQDVSNQLFNVKINSLSADGDTDYVYFRFPDRFAGSLSPNTVDSNISVSSSNSIVDYDGDGNQETVEVGISEDGNSSVYANVTLDTGVSYPQEFSDLEVLVAVEGSSNGQTSTNLQVTNAESESEDPESTSDETDPNDEESTSGDPADTGNQGTEDSSDSSNEDSTESGQGSQDESSEGGFIAGIVSFFTGLF